MNDLAAEKAKLRKSFGRRDIFFLLVCTLVGVDGLGALATKGGAAFTWMIGSVLLFAIPSALLLTELGTTYTDEGGPYVWVRMAFGRLPAALNNLMYWVSNPVWLGGTLVGTAAGAFIVFFGNGARYPAEVMYSIGLPFIWGSVLLTIVSFKVARWVVAVGAIARFALFGLFTIVVLAYGVRYGFHGLGAGSFVPTFSGFTALVPLILFSLVGFELPNTAGEEMLNAARDVPAGIAKSLAATGALYGLPILGILVVLPPSQASGLAGFPQAVKQAVSVFGGVSTEVGWLMGILIATVAFTSGLAWMIGSDRAMAISCLDGAGPRGLGGFSARFGTPVRVNLLSGVAATSVFVTTELITSGNAYKFFSVALSLAISTTLMSYLGIFPAAWALRRDRPGDVRPFRAPFLRLATIVSVALVVFATTETLCPGLGGGWFDAQNLPGPQWQPSERWTYLAAAGAPIVVFLLAGASFWLAGRRAYTDEPVTESLRTFP
jgi:glutamate:GABA antiporter